MTRTLRRERIQKFKEVLTMFGVTFVRSLDAFPEEWEIRFDELAAALVEAAESRTEAQQEETPEEYNVEVFRGDFREYPEHLRKIAEVLRDTWKFVLPEKPRKGEGKGKYKYYVMAMDDLKQACAEFGAEVLIKVHVDWKAGFKNGLAPYTVAQPSSLVNMALAKARELREKSLVSTPVKVDDNGVPETY